MILVVGGVTASGKSDLAFKIARKYNGVIINADAFAIYSDLNIGTAKPSQEELSSTTNYLFNIKNAGENYSIYEYQKSVREIIDKYKNERLIILVGGSALYIRAALYNYELSENNNEVIEDDPKISNQVLYNELLTLDNLAAQKIHVNNRKRVLRALAVIKNNKVLKSESDARTSDIPLYPFTMINLTKESETLDKDIKTRVSEMMKRGLRQEALDLETKYGNNVMALQAIGYKEILANKNMDDEYLIALISLRTRQYAKRQRTFFNNKFESKWFTDPELAYNYIVEIIEG